MSPVGPAQPAAAAARQEHPAQDRAVRLRIDVRAVAGGDRLGGGHRLLAGKAALLDRGVRRVTGGVDALEPLDQAMLVDGDEAVGVGQARDGRPGGHREGEGPIHFDVPPARVHAVVHDIGGDRADELDPLLGEQVRDHGAGLRAEQLERTRLRRDEREVHVVDAGAPHVAGGDDGQLVQRQAPRQAARDDEGDAMRVPLLEVGQQPGQGLRRAVGAERDGVPVDGHASRAYGHEQGVEGERGAVARGDVAPHGIDLLERAAHELGAEVADDLGERVVGGVAEAEGLGDLQRSVDEVRLGGEQRHADAVARKLTESDQRLEGGDAAAGDHDARRR